MPVMHLADPAIQKDQRTLNIQIQQKHAFAIKSIAKNHINNKLYIQEMPCMFPSQKQICERSILLRSLKIVMIVSLQIQTNFCFVWYLWAKNHRTRKLIYEKCNVRIPNTKNVLRGMIQSFIYKKYLVYVPRTSKFNEV